MRMKFPRLAVRAVIVENEQLLLVNAYPGEKSDLWCAPGGGADAGASLPENLIREVLEETGLTIDVGDPIGLNEFKDSSCGFHQVDVFFRAQVIAGTLDPGWRDPEGVVSKRGWFTREAFQRLRVKPDGLGRLAWGNIAGAHYDPMEEIVP